MSTATGSAAHRPRSSWRRFVRSGSFALVAGVSLYLVLPSLLAVFASWRLLADLTWYWAALALVAEVASIVCLWQLNRITLHVRSWFAVGCSQLAGNAVGRVLPGGSATAAAVGVGMLRRAGVEPANATAALTASTTLQLSTRLGLPLLALPAILAGAPVEHGLEVAPYLGLGVLALLVVTGVLVFAFDRPLELVGRALQWLLNHTTRRGRPIRSLAQGLLTVRDFLRSTVGDHWQGAVLSAAGATGFDFLALLCAVRAVGSEGRPSLILLAYAGAGALTLIPFTPGGLGFVEAGLVGLLTLAGIPAGDALLATLTYRLVSYWLPIPAGGVAYLLFRRRYPPAVRASRTRSAPPPIRRQA
jgi:uncharacterized protein (TIRG00374 family)